MALVLDPSRPLPEGLIEAARDAYARAEAALANPSPPNIHSGRKTIKHLRAWLRLLRPQLGDRYRLIDRLLRDSARALAGRRDAHVARQTLLSLRRARLLDAAQYTALSAMAITAPRDADSDTRAEQRALHLLRAAGAYLDALSLPAIDDAQLRDGLQHTYRRCRRGWKHARSSPDVDALHAWRKWVKHLITQIQLLPGPAGDIGVDVRALKILATDLGRHHDHAELLRQLEVAGLDHQPLLHLRLSDAVTRRQHALAQRALRRGRRLMR